MASIPEEEENTALATTIQEIEEIEEKAQRAEIAGAFYIIAGYKYQEPVQKLMEELMQSGTYKEIFQQGEEKRKLFSKYYKLNLKSCFLRLKKN